MTSRLFGWSSEGERTPRGFEVLGVPSDAGNGFLAGARLGPAAIRTASLALPPTGTGIDHGDIGHAHASDLRDVLASVERAALDMFDHGARVVMLGGDHSITYAAVAAAQRHRPLHIVWFDAHTDFFACPDQGWHNHKQVLRRIAGLGHVGRIVQVGHRGIAYFDEAERFDRLAIVPAREAERMDPARLLDLLPTAEAVYVSIDIDVLEPALAPGTGHPVPGGLTVARLIDLASAIVRDRDIVGIDVMEVNPLLDHGGRTSAAAATIIATLLAQWR